MDWSQRLPARIFPTQTRCLPKSILLSFLLLGILSLTSGCSNDSSNSSYYQTFDQIKTNQFIWSYGRGGIYWVSNDAVILDGLVENSEGALERGLYQVALDGTYTRLVEVIDYISWYYCFSEGTLYVRNLTGRFNILAEPEGIKIEKGIRSASHENSTYSQLRCRIVQRPTADGYRPLLLKDGLIKVDRSDPKATYSSIKNSNTKLSDNRGDTKQELTLKVGQLSAPYFLKDRNAYFGYQQRSHCAHLWWLYRDDWRVKTEKRCFGGWASSGGLLPLSTKVGLFLTHYTFKGHTTYLFADGKEFKLEKVPARAATLSPDGCKIAYASGEMKFGKDRYSQVLKIFDACKFVEEQKANDSA